MSTVNKEQAWREIMNLYNTLERVQAINEQRAKEAAANLRKEQSCQNRLSSRPACETQPKIIAPTPHMFSYVSALADSKSFFIH